MRFKHVVNHGCCSLVTNSFKQNSISRTRYNYRYVQFPWNKCSDSGHHAHDFKKYYRSIIMLFNVFWEPFEWFRVKQGTKLTDSEMINNIFVPVLVPVPIIHTRNKQCGIKLFLIDLKISRVYVVFIHIIGIRIKTMHILSHLFYICRWIAYTKTVKQVMTFESW